MEYLIAPESEITKTDEIAENLITVEILYIIAANPTSAREMIARLKTNFGLVAEADHVNVHLENLIVERMIRKFATIPGQDASAGVSQEAFSITPFGLSNLGRWLESLSEITLTMQLGFKQRLASAED